MATTHTNQSVLMAAGIDTAHLEFPELAIPVLSGMQRQGDLIVVPTTVPHEGVPIGKGVAVVEAESASDNTHILLGAGAWCRANRSELVEGWLTVPADGEAFLIHTEEHNALGIGSGWYEIRRQREWDPSAGAAEFEARRRAEDIAEQARWLARREYRKVRD